MIRAAIIVKKIERVTEFEPAKVERKTKFTTKLIRNTEFPFNHNANFSYMLLEDGSYMLQEDGSRIILE